MIWFQVTIWCHPYIYKGIDEMKLNIHSVRQANDVEDRRQHFSLRVWIEIEGGKWAP